MTVTVRVEASRVISSDYEDIRVFIDDENEIQIDHGSGANVLMTRDAAIALADVLRDLAAALPAQPAGGDAG